MQRAEGQGQRHLRRGRTREARQRACEVSRDGGPQRKWCHGNQGGGRGGVACRVGVSRVGQLVQCGGGGGNGLHEEGEIR